MRFHVFRSLEEARGRFGPCALTIGNFDGLHAGHRALIGKVLAQAAETGARPSALTFHPHPAHIVAPERAPRLLTTPDARCALMRAQGVEQVLILPFDARVAALAPEEFFVSVLLGALGLRALTVGSNFRFGYMQGGGAGLLRALCERYGVRFEAVPPVRLRGVTVSSSEIRRLLAAGNVSKAGRLLGRPYELGGRVVRGAGRGARETVPTLNLEKPSLFEEWAAVPAHGVYITRTRDADHPRAWNSITNCGFRPTFGGRHLTIETHLLEPLEGDPPRRIKVEFLRFVRPERAFESSAALRSQIGRDVARAREYFRRLATTRLWQPAR
jgi:riboflavin kinase/FMN adenylyltransferase